jgi:hypothetical protein
MDLGHPGWRDIEGWKVKKNVGDIVLGPCGDDKGYGIVKLVYKGCAWKDEDWLDVLFDDGDRMCGPYTIFYLIDEEKNDVNSKNV